VDQDPDVVHCFTTLLATLFDHDPFRNGRGWRGTGQRQLDVLLALLKVKFGLVVMTRAASWA
jgi:hypothetical protein